MQTAGSVCKRSGRCAHSVHASFLFAFLAFFLDELLEVMVATYCCFICSSQFEFKAVVSIYNTNSGVAAYVAQISAKTTNSQLSLLTYLLSFISPAFVQ